MALYIVIQGHQREITAICRSHSVAGRRRKAITEHIDGNNEVPVWVDSAVRAKESFVSFVGAGIESGQQNGIASVRVKGPIGFISQFGIRQDLPTLQGYVTKRKEIVTHQYSLRYSLTSQSVTAWW